jgi:hypothetical protein
MAFFDIFTGSARRTRQDKTRQDKTPSAIQQPQKPPQQTVVVEVGSAAELRRSCAADSTAGKAAVGMSWGRAAAFVAQRFAPASALSDCSFVAKSSTEMP